MVDTPPGCFVSSTLDFQQRLSEKFSKYIVYVDESGDQNLHSIDPCYPIFVLTFCVFEKNTYADRISPGVKKLKFKHFGHDMAIFHEQDIRKAINQFRFLRQSEHKHIFMNDLNKLIESLPFTLIAVAINKGQQKVNLLNKFSNPYHQAMQCGLENIYEYLKEKNENSGITHIIFEARGKKENTELDIEFKQTCTEKNKWGKSLPFELLLADKRTNCSGLQIADLVARPIGRYILNRGQENRAFEILQQKFYSRNGKVEGYGLQTLAYA